MNSFNSHFLILSFSHFLTFTRSYVLLCLLLLSCTKRDNVHADTLRHSVGWMWDQQSPHGGWHSKTHAVLSDGVVLTPYILFYLLQVPDDVYKSNEIKIDKAIKFIIANMQTSISEDSGTLKDYPNYSAAYALRVLRIMRRDSSFQQKLTKYLVQQQFIEHRGFSPDSLAYGGWGYGEGDLEHGEHGHVDISHTRRVAEALFNKAEARAKDDESKAKESIILFLRGVQRIPEDLRKYNGCLARDKLPYDGGFVSSLVTLATNKSEPFEIAGAGIHYPSYATATCDGFLAMHTLGLQHSQAYADAKKWLIENQNYHTIDGLTDHPEQWDEIMRYYHLAVRAEAMNIIDPGGVWTDSIELILKKEIQPEGYYVNPLGGVNKEDDPLMATIFAIQALNNIFSTQYPLSRKKES